MSSTLVVAIAKNTDITPRGPTIDVFYIGGGRYREYRQHTPGAHHQRLLHLQWWLLPDFSQHPQGPTFDVFNFGGGRCRDYRQHPLGGLPSTSSSSSVVAVARLRPAPLGGPPSTSSTLVVAAAKNTDSTPRAPASTSFISMVAAARNTDNTPRGSPLTLG
jgi:hypothetical protein